MIYVNCSPKNKDIVIKDEAVQVKIDSSHTIENNTPEEEKEVIFAFDFKKEALLSDILDIAKKQNKLVFIDINAK